MSNDLLVRLLRDPGSAADMSAFVVARASSGPHIDTFQVWRIARELGPKATTARVLNDLRRRGLVDVAQRCEAALQADADGPQLPGADHFLMSYEWRVIRMRALKQHGAKCQCCGATAKGGAKIDVDHIKPRRKFPELALDITNLQVLCDACNHGKGNWDSTDWRKGGECRADT